MKKLFFIISLFVAYIAMAQTGELTGVIYDGEISGSGLPFADVYIKGTTKGTNTDMDGKFTISNVDPGVYTIGVSFVGYETKEITGVEIVVGQATKISEVLSLSAATLDDVQIVATTSVKESEAALLKEQKKAVEIKQAIGAKELAKKGVANAEAALAKVTGITKQEGASGGGVFVRGLGDRYNVTTLNGLPLPSDNPSRKNINLALFSTDIIQNIGIEKTFNPENYGDFGGANIDIVSKKHSGENFLELSLATGVNENAISEDDFYLNGEPSSFGFYNKDYPTGNSPYFPLEGYRFDTTLDRSKVGLPINSSVKVRGGFSHSFDNGARLKVFGTGGFSNNYYFRSGPSNGIANRQGLVFTDLDAVQYGYRTNTTGLINASLKNRGQQLDVNIGLINSSHLKQEEYNGILNIFDNAPNGGAFIQRSTYEQTLVWINQLLGKHRLNDDLKLDWGISYNDVLNRIPDRKQNTLTPDDWDEPNGPLSFRQALTTTENHRYFQTLKDQEFAANLRLSYDLLKNEEEEDILTAYVGYSGRFKEVDFQATQFNFDIININDQPVVADRYNLDSYFNQANFEELYQITTFRGNRFIDPNVIDVMQPQFYKGPQRIHAGFVNFKARLGEKLTGLFGFRYERITQDIEWNTALQPSGGEGSLKEDQFLPSLTLKYELNEKQNLKLAASKTYTLPQFKERAPFLYEDVLGAVFGNPNLYSSTNYNLDVKWDYFMNKGELVSLGVFGKFIENAINDINILSAVPVKSFANTGDARAFGAEAEIRKKVLEFDGASDENQNELFFGANVSYLNSKQDLLDEKVSRETEFSTFFTEKESALTGASEWIGNADLSYVHYFSDSFNIQLTPTWNYFSDRIYTLGTETRGNFVDKGFHTLDFIIKTDLNDNISLDINATNLIDPKVKRVQENENQEVLMREYNKGRNFSLKFTYKF